MENYWKTLKAGVLHGLGGLTIYLIVTLVLYGVAEINTKIAIGFLVFSFWVGLRTQIHKDQKLKED